ncbi:hypothetical protein J5N97_007781 [Dioscorea zingiberensis]|uniref:DUF1639 family protein n=1 Tax=Dioscorea zingiberensis TaxID=325984 RepID=A0A9D5DF21_9LILI|nr:hypothetical protein J5N97_007781 [Dioscorea zingiberensis]
MMRYQAVSTECLPLSIGKKPILKACKEDDLVSNNGGRAFDPKPLRASQEHQHHHEPPPPEPERSPASVPKSQNESNGDVLLQWGRRKRTRLSRAESRAAAEDDHESSRPPIKVRRRSAAGSNRLGAAAAMPPPPPPPAFGRLRPSPPVLLPHRITDHSSGSSRPEKRSSPLPQEKASKMAIGDISINSETSCPPKSNRETGDVAGASTTTNEWPRIFISLSRKEKEDDFLAMKGTKLPQRPKKRAKNIEKTLQYCFPGLWLSELTRGRYEVRERKCVKKKRRGLKGMESMDSDSE